MNIIQSLFISEAEARHDAAKWLEEGLASPRVVAGVDITEESMLSASAIFDAVRVIAEDVAKLPIPLYQIVGKGKEKLKSDLRYKLLNRRPNKNTTPFNFKQCITACAVLYGNGYAEIQRDGRGNPVGLWQIHPRRVKPIYGDHDELSYDVRNPEHETVTIPSENMIHISGFGDNGIAGRMIAKLGYESFGLLLAVERFGSSFFGNGAVFSGTIAMPPGKSMTVEQYQEYIKRIKEQHTGPSNTNKLLVLTNGETYTKTSAANEEAQFLETRQFQIEEVARWFRVAPHKLQHLLRSTFSNIEHQSLEHVGDCIMPWATRWEEELDYKLIREDEADTLEFEFLLDALYRADLKSRSEANKVQLQNGALTIDEWRAMENRNPLPNGMGETHWMMMNMATVDNVIRGQSTATTPNTENTENTESGNQNDGKDENDQSVA